MKAAEIAEAKNIERGLLLVIEGMGILTDVAGANRDPEMVAYRILLKGTLVEVRDTIAKLEHEEHAETPPA